MKVEPACEKEEVGQEGRWLQVPHDWRMRSKSTWAVNVTVARPVKSASI